MERVLGLENHHFSPVTGQAESGKKQKRMLNLSGNSDKQKSRTSPRFHMSSHRLLSNCQGGQNKIVTIQEKTWTTPWVSGQRDTPKGEGDSSEL